MRNVLPGTAGPASHPSQGGRKLPFSQAANRTLQVLWFGLGFSIPIYNLYRLWKSCATCERGDPLPWDERVAYTIRDTKGWRVVLVLAARVAVLGLVVIIALQAQMPKHRGPLTEGQLVENIRDSCRYRGMTTGLLPGEDVPKRQDDFAFFLDAPSTVEWKVVTGPDGTVIGLEVWEKISEPNMLFSGRTDPLVLTYALVGADRTYNLFTLPEAPWLEWVQSLGTQPSHMEAAGWRMEYQIEHQGMEDVGTMLIREQESTPAWVEWRFTISRVEG